MMTDEQKSQFQAYGCLSRCLIAIAAASNKPITFDDYVTKFSHLFEDWCGCISYGKVTEVIRTLGFGNTFYIFRDPEAVEKRFNFNPRPRIVLCIERDPMDYSEKRHSFLVVGMESKKFHAGVFATEDEVFPSQYLELSFEEVDRLSGFFLLLH